MMSEQLVTASKPDYNVIPVQLSAEEFEKFILPPLSLPKCGPQCKIGYHKPFNSILKVLYTGMQWKELPIDKGSEGKAELHYPESSSSLPAGQRMARSNTPSLLRSNIWISVRG